MTGNYVNRLKCEICQYLAFSIANLKIHIESIHEGVTYSCDSCEKIFTTRGNLRTHQEIHGKEILPYPKCPYKTYSKNYLKTHDKQIHGEATLKCKLCNYKTTRHGHLYRHIRIYMIQRKKLTARIVLISRPTKIVSNYIDKLYMMAKLSSVIFAIIGPVIKPTSTGTRRQFMIRVAFLNVPIVTLKQEVNPILVDMRILCTPPLV